MWFLTFWNTPMTPVFGASSTTTSVVGAPFSPVITQFHTSVTPCPYQPWSRGMLTGRTSSQGAGMSGGM